MIIFTNDSIYFFKTMDPIILFSTTEKQLRDAAAAEVALVGSSCGDDEMVMGADGKPSRKRKALNPDEKAKQNRDRNREHAKVLTIIL